MNKQKLISVLQSRIAKRRDYLADGWELFDDLKRDEDTEYEAYYFIVTLINVGKEQKEDKQILRQLVEDERELKLLRECAKNLQGRIDTLLGWNK